MQSLCDQTTCYTVSPKGAPIYHDWFDLSPSYVRENVQFLDRTVLDSDTDVGRVNELGADVFVWVRHRHVAGNAYPSAADWINTMLTEKRSREVAVITSTHEHQ